jgi:hypothetical protein
MTTKNERWMLARGYRAVYQGARCTLDGKPAGIHDAEQGREAEIRPDDSTHGALRCTWGAVAMVMSQHGGRFTS